MDRRWILYLLLAGLMVAIIWRNEFSDKADPSWTRCTESLLEQVFTSNCTLRYQGEPTPS